MKKMHDIQHPAVMKTFLDAVEAGNFISTACGLAGVHYVTLRQLLVRAGKERKNRRLGRETNPQMDWAVQFIEDYEKASAKAEAKDLELIHEAAKSQWQAAAWRLERRFPKHWGRTYKFTNEEESRRAEASTKKVNGKSLDKMTTDELENLMKKIAEEQSA